VRAPDRDPHIELADDGAEPQPDWLPELEESEWAGSPSADSESSVQLLDDAIAAYLRQIGDIPLLQPEEEIQLAEVIARGRKAAVELARLPEAGPDQSLSAERLEQSRQAVAEGEAARRRFVAANTRLVVGEAKRYTGAGLPFADVVQAGNEGLIKAVDRFDSSLGYRFSTYATWWIRQTIRRSLTRQGHAIRLPAHARQRALKLRRTSRRLEERLGRRPNVEEIAEAAGLENSYGTSQLLQISREPVSLDAPVSGGDGDTELVELVEDNESASPVVRAQQHLMRDHLTALIEDALSPREREVIARRYGLNGRDPETLRDVAESLGVSRERVRQIQRRALRRLRSPRSWKTLRAFLR